MRKMNIRSGVPSGGFTIVEVLIAMVVVAVGLLGIAGLYVVTLRSGGSAISRMQAVNLAADIADRIRANRTAGLAYAGGAANNNCYGDGTVNCAPDQLAAHDLLVWRAQIGTALPAGAGTVAVVDAGPLNTYTVTITWTEPGAGGDLNYTLNFQV